MIDLESGRRTCRCANIIGFAPRKSTVGGLVPMNKTNLRRNRAPALTRACVCSAVFYGIHRRGNACCDGGVRTKAGEPQRKF
jgi:hypothetical protein